MRIIIPIALAALALPAIAQSEPFAAVPASEKTSTIIVYRPGTVAGAAIACPVRIDGIKLVELGRNKQFVWQVKPGRYVLENKKGGVEVIVAAGETKYVRCVMKLNMVTYSAKLRSSDASEYAEIKEQLEAPGE